MNLFREIKNTSGWFGRLAHAFFRAKPATSCLAVISALVGKVTGILAFLLPLKVILLVASDGVSKWFQPFVGPGGKDTLVTVLISLAVISFFASIVLDTLTEKLAGITSSKVVSGANELAIVGNQSEQARTIYSEFANVVSGALFVAAGGAVIALVNPFLALVVAGLFVLWLFLTTLIVAGPEPVQPGMLRRFVTRDLKDYLDVLSSTTFLVAFGVLIYPFLWGDGGSVIAALVSVIVLRRGLGALTETVNGTVKMVRRAPVINALVFPGHQYQRVEKNANRTLRDAFDKSARQARAEELLTSAGHDIRSVEAEWVDSGLGGLTLLHIAAKTAADETLEYQQQIYWPRQDYRLENEAVLFGYLDRTVMHAPEMLLRFNEGPFECQLCRVYGKTGLGDDKWPEIQWRILTRLMSVKPPEPLVRAYSASRPFMAERLGDEFIGRIELAVDSTAERKAFEDFFAALPALRAQLRGIPLYVNNPEMKEYNLGRGSQDEPLIMTWGKWSLEPLGVGLPKKVKDEQLAELVETLRRERSDVGDGFSMTHLELAYLSAKLEQLVNANAMKAALETVNELLECMEKQRDGGEESSAIG